MLAFPVNQDSAGSALALATAIFRAGELEVLSKQVEQRALRVGGHGACAAVNSEGKGDIDSLAESNPV